MTIFKAVAGDVTFGTSPKAFTDAETFYNWLITVSFTVRKYQDSKTVCGHYEQNSRHSPGAVSQTVKFLIFLENLSF
jgi:hypothetical protein